MESVTLNIFKTELDKALSNLIDPVLSRKLSQRPEVPLSLNDSMHCKPRKGHGPLKCNFAVLYL